jgi:hypothetical protein
MNKLKTSAVATGLFLAGSFAAFEVDNSTSNKISSEKVECYKTSSDQAKDCVAAIDNNNESQYFAIEVLEGGLLLAAAACGLEFVRSLRKLED